MWLCVLVYGCAVNFVFVKEALHVHVFLGILESLKIMGKLYISAPVHRCPALQCVVIIVDEHCKCVWYVCVHACACMYMCMYMYMYVYTYVCVHTHTYNYVCNVFSNLMDCISVTCRDHQPDSNPPACYEIALPTSKWQNSEQTTAAQHSPRPSNNSV